MCIRMPQSLDFGDPALKWSTRQSNLTPIRQIRIRPFCEGYTLGGKIQLYPNFSRREKIAVKNNVTFPLFTTSPHAGDNITIYCAGVTSFHEQGIESGTIVYFLPGHQSVSIPPNPEDASLSESANVVDNAIPNPAFFKWNCNISLLLFGWVHCFFQ